MQETQAAEHHGKENLVIAVSKKFWFWQNRPVDICLYKYLVLSTDRADSKVQEPGISPGFYFHGKQKKNTEPKELPSF